MAQLKPGHIKIRSFSLFESVVAIALISVLIGIATVIYGNLVEAERPVSFYQAKEEIDRYYAEMKASHAYISTSFDHDTYRIDQQVDFYKGNKKLYLVEYTITTQGKVWWKEKHLITNVQ